MEQNNEAPCGKTAEYWATENKRGFTLIELLVVVLIIGILASLAVPQYFKVVEKSRVAEAMSAISTIKSAEERYLASAGSYGNTDQLDVSYTGASDGNITLKFFNIVVTAHSVTGEPGYLIKAARIVSSVPARYGGYTLSVNIPSNVQVFANNTLVSTELLDIKTTATTTDPRALE